MKTINAQGAQGDVMFLRVSSLPASAKQEARAGALIVAHSETGHNHAIDVSDVSLFREPGDPLICYLSVGGDGCEVVHHRSFDTHETIKLPAGFWQVRRQREYTPQGWRRVED